MPLGPCGRPRADRTPVRLRFCAELRQTTSRRPTVGSAKPREGLLRHGADDEVEPVVLVECDIHGGGSTRSATLRPGSPPCRSRYSSVAAPACTVEAAADPGVSARSRAGSSWQRSGRDCSPNAAAARDGRQLLGEIAGVSLRHRRQARSDRASPGPCSPLAREGRGQHSAAVQGMHWCGLLSLQHAVPVCKLTRGISCSEQEGRRSTRMTRGAR